MYTQQAPQSTQRNEKPRRGERRGSGGERPRMFIAALRRPSEISARQSHHLSPEGFEPIRPPTRCSAPCAGCGPLFVAQKSQVEILIVVTETASRVPELRCCGGDPLFRIPQTWLRFGGAVCLPAAATCPALGAAAPSAKGLSTASTWRLRMSLIAKTELSGRRHPAV